MKKLLSIILVVLMLTVLLASCGTPVNTNTETDTNTESNVNTDNTNTDTSIDTENSNELDIEALLYEGLSEATLRLDGTDTRFFVSTKEKGGTYDFSNQETLYSIAYPYIDYENPEWPINVELALPDTLKNKVDFLNATVTGANPQNNKYCYIGETDFWNNSNCLEMYVGFESPLAFENEFTHYSVEVQFAYDETPNEEGLHQNPDPNHEYFGCIKFAIQAYKPYVDLGRFGYEEISKESALLIAETHFFGCIYKEDMLEDGAGWYYYPEFTGSMENSPNHWYIIMGQRKYTMLGDFADDVLLKTAIYTINKYTGEIVDVKLIGFSAGELS